MKKKEKKKYIILGIVAVALVIIIIWLAFGGRESSIPVPTPYLGLYSDLVEETPAPGGDGPAAEAESEKRTSNGGEWELPEVEVIIPASEAEADAYEAAYVSEGSVEPEYFEGVSGLSYVNDKELYYSFPDGSGLYLGTNYAEDGNGLYLSPSYVPSESEDQMFPGGTEYGFYITCSSGSISTWTDNATDVDSASNSDDLQFLISDRTYDTLIPATYMSREQYGVVWNSYAINAEEAADAMLSIRIFRIRDGQFKGIVHAKIAFDSRSSSYSLQSITDADVLTTGELSAGERKAIIDAAVDLLLDDSKGQRTDFALDYATAEKTAVVESVSRVYFPKFFSTTGTLKKAGNYSHCDIYAVNIPYSGASVLTVYFAPSLQVMGLSSATAPGSTDKDLIAIGFDAFYPYTHNSLFVPAEYADEFF